jgi:hypothetical protein
MRRRNIMVVAGLVVGMVASATSLWQSHAQQQAPAYIITEIDVTDAAAFADVPVDR